MAERLGGRTDDAWIFEGEVVFNNLDHLKTFVSKAFGTSLPNLNFTLQGKLIGDLAFNNNTKECQLSLRTMLELADRTAADIQLDITIAPDRPVQFGGELDLSATDGEAMRFRFTVVDGSLIAVYADTGISKVDVAAVAQLLGTDKLKRLNIAIPGAAFAIGQSHKLLALNLGLDIGAISVPGLPIVPDSTAAGISAHLDFQLVWSKLKVDEPLRAAIAHYLRHQRLKRGGILS